MSDRPAHIPYGKQNINQADIDSVVNVLSSDFITQGPYIERFEGSVANKCNVKFSIATNSATSALHLACLSLGLQKGDIAWTSPISFVASANCILYCQATVDFIDIDRSTANICPSALAEKLELAAKNNALPKLIIVVHMGGSSCDMQKISALCQQYKINIIEDASHAIGGRYLGNPIGCCQYSDITIFSFHPVKIITTAEGGMALTNSPEYAQKMKLLRSHGITKEEENFIGDNQGGDWYYQQQHLGFNYRITDIQAALGLSQLKRLDKFIEERLSIAMSYREKLKRLELPIAIQQILPNSQSAFHLFLVRVLPEANKTRQQLFDYLRRHNIGVNVHYIPIHTQPYYSALGFKIGDFPQAESYYQQVISLPLFPDLTESQQDYIVDKIHLCLTS